MPEPSPTSSELHGLEDAAAASGASTSAPSTREQRIKVESNIRMALFVLVKLAERRALGALCKTDCGGERLHLFICTATALPANSREDLGDAMLQLPNRRKDIRIPLPRGSVRHVWRARHFDAAVVELTAEAAKACELLGANFLQVGTARDEQEVCWNSNLFCTIVSYS